MNYLNYKSQPFGLSAMLITIFTLSHCLRERKFYHCLTLSVFFKVQFMHRFSQKFLPSSFDQAWIRNDIRNIGKNKIQLRNNSRLQLPPSRTALTDRLPTFNFPRTWEQFPDEQIKFIRKKIEFDTKLKKFYINDLADSIVCNRLFCPTCSNN